MLNLRRLQDKKISKIDIESEGKVLNLRRQRNRKIFVTSERSSEKPGDLNPPPYRPCPASRHSSQLKDVPDRMITVPEVITGLQLISGYSESQIAQLITDPELITDRAAGTEYW